MISDSQSTTVEEVLNPVESEPELTVTAEVKYFVGQKAKTTDTLSNVQTPIITSPVRCSTERANRGTASDENTTPTGSPRKLTTVMEKGIVDISVEGGKV